MKCPSLIHAIGADLVAGRSVIVQLVSTGEALMERPIAEAAAFMDGGKRILIFSMAGGTGRSCHADLACASAERRVHLLLEVGWRTEFAAQSKRAETRELGDPGEH